MGEVRSCWAGETGGGGGGAEAGGDGGPCAGESGSRCPAKGGLGVGEASSGIRGVPGKGGAGVEVDAAAWGMQRSTSGVAGDEAGSSNSCRHAAQPVPAPWLGSNAGEYATPTNWSGESADECMGGATGVDDGILANGNKFSSKTTSREI